MGYIAVDLDGTLAVYDGMGKPIGEPVPAMAFRVRKWLSEGKTVKIFTARAAAPELIPEVEDWSLKHFGVILPVTNEKDFGMIELWDDRAIQIEFNTGRRMDGKQ